MNLRNKKQIQLLLVGGDAEEIEQGPERGSLEIIAQPRKCQVKLLPNFPPNGDIR